jgi:hypothetical protein
MSEDRERQLEGHENAELRDFLDVRKFRQWLIASLRPAGAWIAGAAAVVTFLHEQLAWIARLIITVLQGFGQGTGQ